MITTSTQVASEPYARRAEEIFLHPSTLYRWSDVVSGARVASATGQSRMMTAVAQNTFRGFHRVSKNCPGARAEFIKFFLDQHTELEKGLRAARTRDDLHSFSNGCCDRLRERLSNVAVHQLASYNKLRKPVDLYLEHLVCMSVELQDDRCRLVPLLFLPLDSQILAEPQIFGENELAANGLTRSSTYQEIRMEKSYLHLQSAVTRKCSVISEQIGRPFYAIYFDLVWNNRSSNWGSNLFETNP